MSKIYVIDHVNPDTERDHQAAERLAGWTFTGGSPLEGEDIAFFGEALLSAGSGLAALDPDEVVASDLKVYDAAGKRFGIAQAEVTDLHRVSDHLEALSQALDRLSDKRGLNFSLLMITDVVDGASRILMQGSSMVLEELPYKRLSDGTLDARGVVSRKKQLLPVVLALLEE